MGYSFSEEQFDSLLGNGHQALYWTCSQACHSKSLDLADVLLPVFSLFLKSHCRNSPFRRSRILSVILSKIIHKNNIFIFQWLLEFGICRCLLEDLEYSCASLGSTACLQTFRPKWFWKTHGCFDCFCGFCLFPWIFGLSFKIKRKLNSTGFDSIENVQTVGLRRDVSTTAAWYIDWPVFEGLYSSISIILQNI